MRFPAPVARAVNIGSGRERCPLWSALVSDPELVERGVANDVARIVRSVSGRRLSAYIRGDDQRSISLTDMYAVGAGRASALIAHLNTDDTVLEYGGNIGRVGRTVGQSVRRLVSVDHEPLTAVYGPRLTRCTPGIEFLEHRALAPVAVFDAAYAVESFPFLTLDEKAEALNYMHRRLKPGGVVLVDVRLGHGVRRDRCGRSIHKVSEAQLRAISEPYFDVAAVPLLNSGFALWKRVDVEVAGTPYFRGNWADVVVPVRGEIVNVRTGALYELNATAVAMWDLLAAGVDVPAVAARVGGRPVAQVEQFAEQLAVECLLVPSPVAGRPVDRPMVDEDVCAADGAPPALVRVPGRPRRRRKNDPAGERPTARLLLAAVTAQRVGTRVAFAGSAAAAGTAMRRISRAGASPGAVAVAALAIAATAPGVPVLTLRWARPRSSAMMREVRAGLRATGRPGRVEFTWVPLRYVPRHVWLAAVAAEDGYFAHHGGFDWFSVRDAIVHNLAGGSKRGASTITQQVAKNVFLWSRRSWARKLAEAYIALLVEALWPKRRILEVYLNVAQFAPTAFGVEAAAQLAFDKPARDLTAAEAALLVTALPSPNRLRIDAPTRAMRFRRAAVMHAMAGLGDLYLDQL